MRKILSTIAAICISGLIATAAPVPQLPATPQYSDPAVLVATINALIQQLNGNSSYAPAQNVSLGISGTASGATPVTLNAQHGVVSFTNVGTLVTGAVTTLTVTDSQIIPSSQCFGQIQSGGAAGSGPYVSTVTPAAGSAAFIIANGGTTATGAAQTFAIAFTCL